jgi:hypothetical protein
MPEFLQTPWPWWMGVIGLTTVSLLIWTIERRLLGVSGCYRRLVTKVSKTEADLVAALSQNDTQSIEDELLKATIEEFGEDAVNMYKEASEEQEQLEEERQVVSPPQPQCVYGIFLFAVAAGGVVSALLAGSLEPRWTLGPVYEVLVAGGAGGAVVLFLGGILIGFGTRMSGGCTSGHGLSGCSRFQPASLAATAAFFGAGVVVSLALSAIAGGGL